MKKISILATVFFIGILLGWGVLKFYRVQGEKFYTLKQTLIAQEKQQFNVYINALTNTVLFSCTQKFADFKGATLSPAFYHQEATYTSQFVDAQQTFDNTLIQVKNLFGGDLGKKADDFLSDGNPSISFSANEVTRGYCLSFQDNFPQKISDNIKRYQLSAPSELSAFSHKNAIYLDSHLHMVNMTNDLTKKNVPTQLLIGEKLYHLQCHYVDVQQYEQAIALNTPLHNDFYKIAYTFHQNYSPQMDYLLTCQIDKPLPIVQTLQFDDTYPWYRPIATGSHDELTAGDVLSYINKNQFILVLGHEPCACNQNMEQQCAEIKRASRDYQKVIFKLLASLERDKPHYNAVVQQAIDNYVVFGKNEIKKDFCFIDKKALENNLAILVKTMRANQIRN